MLISSFPSGGYPGTRLPPTATFFQQPNFHIKKNIFILVIMSIALKKAKSWGSGASGRKKIFSKSNRQKCEAVGTRVPGCPHKG